MRRRGLQDAALTHLRHHSGTAQRACPAVCMVSKLGLMCRRAANQKDGGRQACERRRRELTGRRKGKSGAGGASPAFCTFPELNVRGPVLTGNQSSCSTMLELASPSTHIAAACKRHVHSEIEARPVNTIGRHISRELRNWGSTQQAGKLKLRLHQLSVTAAAAQSPRRRRRCHCRPPPAAPQP